MNSIFDNKAQSIMEYTIVISLVVVALSAMQVYIKRGIQAGIKVVADELGEQQDAERNPQSGAQTDSVDSEIDTITNSTTTVKLFTGGSRKITIDKTVTNTGETKYISEK